MYSLYLDLVLSVSWWHGAGFPSAHAHCLSVCLPRGASPLLLLQASSSVLCQPFPVCALTRAVFPTIVPVMLYSYNRFESAKCGYFVWSRILKSCLHSCALLLQELLRASMLSPCCFSVLHGLFLQVIQTRSKTIKTLQNVFLGVCLILAIFHLPLQKCL